MSNTLYSARVSALNHGGQPSTAASLGSLSTLALAPTSSGLGAFVALWQTSATVRWTPRPAAPADQAAQGYRLEASVDAAMGTAYAVASTTNGLDGQLTLAGLVPNVTFYLRVGSLNADGAANWLILGSTTIAPTQTMTGQVVASTTTETTVGLSVSTTPTSVVEQIAVEAPPATFSTGTVVALNTAPTAVPPPTSIDGKLTSLNAAGEITAGGQQPLAPVRIRMRYDPLKMPVLGPRRFLRMARYHTLLRRWLLLRTTHLTLTNEVVGETDHFSLFALFIVEAAPNLDSVLVMPVPWKPGSGNVDYDAAALMIRNMTSPATVRIYNMLGEHVWTGHADANGALDWPGIDGGGRRMPSGIYHILIDGGGQTVRHRAVIIR